MLCTKIIKQGKESVRLGVVRGVLSNEGTFEQ